MANDIVTLTSEESARMEPGDRRVLVSTDVATGARSVVPAGARNSIFGSAHIGGFMSHALSYFWAMLDAIGNIFASGSPAVGEDEEPQSLWAAEFYGWANEWKTETAPYYNYVLGSGKKPLVEREDDPYTGEIRYKFSIDGTEYWSDRERPEFIDRYPEGGRPPEEPKEPSFTVPDWIYTGFDLLHSSADLGLGRAGIDPEMRDYYDHFLERNFEKWVIGAYERVSSYVVRAAGIGDNALVQWQLGQWDGVLYAARDLVGTIDDAMDPRNNPAINPLFWVDAIHRTLSTAEELVKASAKFASELKDVKYASMKFGDQLGHLVERAGSEPSKLVLDLLQSINSPFYTYLQARIASAGASSSSLSNVGPRYSGYVVGYASAMLLLPLAAESGAAQFAAQLEEAGGIGGFFRNLLRRFKKDPTIPTIPPGTGSPKTYIARQYHVVLADDLGRTFEELQPWLKSTDGVDVLAKLGKYHPNLGQMNWADEAYHAFEQAARTSPRAGADPLRRRKCVRFQQGTEASASKWVLVYQPPSNGDLRP